MSTIQNDINKFCLLNEIIDVKKFTNECLELGFTSKKYGNKPDLTSIKPVQSENRGNEVITNNNIIKKTNNDDDYGVYDK